jgi:cytochrome oxidase Cu insertion factor (SCO1/SenC/PrrC family)
VPRKTASLLFPYCPAAGKANVVAKIRTMAKILVLRYEYGVMDVNEKAPDFTTQDENGNTVRLSQFRGKHVVLFFYPKANTPG